MPIGIPLTAPALSVRSEMIVNAGGVAGNIGIVGGKPLAKLRLRVLNGPIMKNTFAILLLTSLSVFGDELPELFEKPWTAWYCGYEGRDFHFGVDPDGEASLIPLKKKDERFSSREWIKITPVIEEILPGGKVVTKKTVDDGWEAITESSDEAENISYRGTVTGGARFEAHFEIDGSVVSGGGRILEKGELKNPIRFVINVKIPNCYSYEDDPDKLENKAKRDRVDLVMADKSRKKFDVIDPVDAEKESGNGVKSARIDLAGFDGGRLELDAGNAGTFEFENRGPSPLYKGFTLGWKPDPAKDPKGEARFELEYK